MRFALFRFPLGDPVNLFARIPIVNNMWLFVVFFFSTWAASRIGVWGLAGLFPASFCCSFAATFERICIYFSSEPFPVRFASLFPRLTVFFSNTLSSPFRLQSSRSFSPSDIETSVMTSSSSAFRLASSAALAAAAATASSLPCTVCRSSGIGAPWLSGTARDIELM